MTQSNLLSVASAFIVDLAGPGPDPFTEDDGRFDVQDRFYDVMFSICASTRRLGYMQVFGNSRLVRRSGACPMLVTWTECVVPIIISLHVLPPKCALILSCIASYSR